VRRADADGAVAALAGAGIVDDARTAESRARSLAERGWGDAAVAARLGGEGFGSDEVAAALAELRPERERAEELAARGGDARAAWKLLARRGFALETVEDVVGVLDADR
jgi:SOS response regulatory protein OraA/RecX